MEKSPKYSISSASETIKEEKGFLIYNDNMQLMANHFGVVYSPICKKVAMVLVKDINEILLLDAYLDDEDRKKGFTYSKVSKNPKFHEFSKKQELMSFAVCVHNTLIAVQNDPNFCLDVEKVIQWDFLYRMSPGPVENMKQMQASEAAIQWLGKDWVDLPGDYVSTLEEMEIDDIPFVPQLIVDRLTTEIATMTKPEEVAVWYLYEFFDCFSITIPILWVKGLVPTTVLEESYYILTSGFSRKKIRAIRKQEENFVQRRLSYLRKYLSTIQPNNKDI